MRDANRRAFIARSLICLGAAAAVGSLGIAAAQTPAPAPTPATSVKWVCPPCGCAADGKQFDAPGSCPECGMTLIPKTVAADPTPTKPADNSANPAGKPSAAPPSAARPTPPAAPTPPQ